MTQYHPVSRMVLEGSEQIKNINKIINKRNTDD